MIKNISNWLLIIEEFQVLYLKIQCEIHCLRWSIIIHYQRFTTSAVNPLLHVLFSSLSLRCSPLGFSFSEGTGGKRKKSQASLPSPLEAQYHWALGGLYTSWRTCTICYTATLSIFLAL